MIKAALFNFYLLGVVEWIDLGVTLRVAIFGYNASLFLELKSTESNYYNYFIFREIPVNIFLYETTRPFLRS